MTDKTNTTDEVKGNSRVIVTNQTGIHEKLEQVVEKHLSHPFQKPFQAHTKQAFAEVNAHVQAFLVKNPQGKIILDACCGVGQSTRILAGQHPHALVIGVDKSAHRINRQVENETSVTNYHLVRADLNDFYRLVKEANWPISKHYILYPNPWPKSKHLQRRWHGSGVFPQMITLGEEIILRSNWQLYLAEFLQAADIAGLQGEITELSIDEAQPLTPFEAKYHASGQQCWQLVITPANYHF